MTDHPEWLGLLADILARPEDDFPRLVASDWLSDHGEGDRAEFIRLQVSLPALEKEADTLAARAGEDAFVAWRDVRRRADHSRRRLNQLIDDGGDWLAGADCLRSFLDRGFWHWGGQEEEALVSLHWDGCADRSGRRREVDVELTWRRGFLARVRLPLAAFQAHGPAMVRAQPLEQVRLSDREPGEGDDAGVYWFCRIEGKGRAWPEPRDVPADIYWYLAGAVRDDWGDRFAYYPTADAAHADLSRACLLWARQAALGPDA